MVTGCRSQGEAIADILPSGLSSRMVWDALPEMWSPERGRRGGYGGGRIGDVDLDQFWMYRIAFLN